MKAEELFPGALVRVNRDGLCIKKDTIVERYKVGSSTYSDYDDALIALLYERRHTSATTTMEVLHKQLWEV